jgi:hypothetical protein
MAAVSRHVRHETNPSAHVLGSDETELPQPAAPPAGADDSPADEAFEVAIAAIRACNAGLAANPAVRSRFSPIVGSHGSSHQQVADWLRDGISPDVILRTIGVHARAYQPNGRHKQIHSLTYFDDPVREAHDRAQASSDAEALPAVGAAESVDRNSLHEVLRLSGELAVWARRIEARFVAAVGEDAELRAWASEHEANMRRAWSNDPRWARWGGRFQSAVLRIRVLSHYGKRLGDPAPGALPPD